MPDTAAAGWLRRPPRIGAADYRIFLVNQMVTVIAAAMHVGFAVIFFTGELFSMVLVNLGSIAAWATAFVLNRKGRFGAAIFIGVAEIYIHAFLAAWIAGLGSGFQFYAWTAAGLSIVHLRIPRLLATVVALLSCVLFATLFLILPNGYIVPSMASMQPALHFFNAMAAPLPVILVAAVSRRVFAFRESVLRDVAERDELTGLYNRRHGMAFLAEAARLATKNNTTLFVVLGDVDHFVAPEIPRKATRSTTLVR